VPRTFRIVIILKCSEIEHVAISHNAFPHSSESLAPFTDICEHFGEMRRLGIVKGIPFIKGEGPMRDDLYSASLLLCCNVIARVTFIGIHQKDSQIEQIVSKVEVFDCFISLVDYVTGI
jgi:hypothetical protein